MTSNEELLVLFWYQWKEVAHTYPLVPKSKERIYSKTLGKGWQPPPSVDVLQKNIFSRQGLKLTFVVKIKDYRYHDFPNTEFSYFLTIDTRQ